MNKELLFELLRAARDRVNPQTDGHDQQEVLRHAEYLQAEGYIGHPNGRVVKMASGEFRLLRKVTFRHTPPGMLDNDPIWVPAINPSGLEKLSAWEHPF